MSEGINICVRCRRPVIVNAQDYALFERMHWLCFHLEFEHAADPDEPCQDPSCPWWHIEVFKNELKSVGRDPEKIIGQAIAERGKQ